MAGSRGLGTGKTDLASFVIQFGSGFRFDAKMEDFGREMVEQCGGLPLAIVVLGGILARKHTLDQWQEVHRNLNKYLKGEGHGGNYNNVMKVLALSYQDLPYQLKACFLYLGSYPEDSDIEVEKLYELWMAEGFIQTSAEGGRNGKEETMMDVAECYLGELATRSLVQVESSGRYKRCRIHDLLRDLCLIKMEEENFLKVIDTRKKGHVCSSTFMEGSSMGNSNSNSNGYKIHRLAIYLDEDTDDAFHLLQQLKGIQDIRSVSFFHPQLCPILDVKLTHFGKKFKMLRVLDLSEFNFGKHGKHKGLPKEIGNLVLLRYLDLRDSRCLKKLPSSIGNLRLLQTLDLRVLSTHVPNVLWRIEGLMHLYLPILYSGRVRIDGLSNLETLENFVASQSDVNGLFSLTKLRRLINASIHRDLESLAAINSYLNSTSSKWLEYTSISIYDCDLDSENGLHLLTELLHCDHLGELSISGRTGRLPEYDSHCYKSLTCLSLMDSELQNKAIATLEKLPNLKDLTLTGNVFVIRHMVCSTKGFPQLKTLMLAEMNLEEWEVDDGAMPNLSCLIIEKCYNLKMLPDGLRFVTSLESLSIVDMPEAFNNRLRVVDGIGGEDIGKVAHVPYINFE